VLRVTYPGETAARNLVYSGRMVAIAMPAGSHWRCGVLDEAPSGPGITSAEIKCFGTSGEAAASRSFCSRTGSPEPQVATIELFEPGAASHSTYMALGCFFQ
jgi:hypothetical protein